MKYLIAKSIYEYNKEYDYYSRTEYGEQLANTICEYLLKHIKSLKLKYTSNEYENITLITDTLKNEKLSNFLNTHFNLNLNNKLLDEYITDIIEVDLPVYQPFKSYIQIITDDKFKKYFNMSRIDLYKKIAKIVTGEVLADLVNYISKMPINNRSISDSDADTIIYKIFYKIGKDYKFGNTILQNHFSLSPEDAYHLIGEDWDTIIYDGKYIPEIDREELRNSIKETIINLNPEIRGNRTEYLLNLDNDDKIDQYYGSINYDPHDLGNRDAPIIVCREFNEDNTWKDHILIGTLGEHHYHVQDRHPELMQRCLRDNKLWCSECYLFGKVAFIEKLGFSGYSSEKEVANILRTDSRILKVYLSPGRNGGLLKRLAKKF